MVTYNYKHNQANGEDNRDGSNSNNSYNYGVEGPIPDPNLRRLRLQQMKNFLATLMLSVGVPMVLAGDELGQSQQGNNNAYCQDNPISWCDWTETSASREITRLVEQAAAIRREFPQFRRDTHLRSDEASWLHYAGREMRDSDWHNSELRSLGLLLYGDSQLLMLMNSAADPVKFKIDKNLGKIGRVLIDTADHGQPDHRPINPRTPHSVTLEGRSFFLCVMNPPKWVR